MKPKKELTTDRRDIWECAWRLRRPGRDDRRFGLRLTRYETAGMASGPSVYHRHTDGGFVSILLKGSFLDDILRNVNVSGSMEPDRHDSAIRKAGSIRLYGTHDYHDLRVLSPTAWSLCIWWGPRFYFDELEHAGKGYRKKTAGH